MTRSIERMAAAGSGACGVLVVLKMGWAPMPTWGVIAVIGATSFVLELVAGWPAFKASWSADEGKE